MAAFLIPTVAVGRDFCSWISLFFPSHLFSPSACFFWWWRVLMRISRFHRLTFFSTYHWWWVEAKLEALSNCGLNQIFLQVLFFNTDSRKLSCLSSLLLVGFLLLLLLSFFFVLCMYVLFCKVEGKRASYCFILSSYPGNLFLQFLLKVVIYLLYHFRDLSWKRVQLQAKMLF